MKIEVDREKCSAIGTCFQVAPEYFDQDDDGLVVLLQDTVSDDEEDADRKAVDEAIIRCGANAIRYADQ
jgi:ferredoxin